MERIGSPDLSVPFNALDIVDAYLEGAEWADEHQAERWISVDEELPNDDVFVLTINRIYVQEVCHRSDGKWINNHNVVHGGVTHWMPLPKPPKKGGDQ